MSNNDRRYTRFIVDNGAYTALGRDFTKVGKVKDISLGGLSFEYLTDANETAEGISYIDLFLTNDDFHMSGLAIKVIYDRPNGDIDPNSSGTIKKNRCAVQFLSLSDSRKDRLDFFIKNHTVGVVP